VLPRCRDLARSDMEMSFSLSRFEVRLRPHCQGRGAVSPRRGRARAKYSSGPGRVKSEYSRREDLAAAGNGREYLAKALKNMP
jgi:hypothetical protein